MVSKCDHDLIRSYELTPHRSQGQCFTTRYVNTYRISEYVVNQSQRVYSDPEMFNPDRFIKDNAIDESVMDPMTVAFGFGRRSV